MLENMIQTIRKQITKLIFIVRYGKINNEKECWGTYLYNEKIVKYITPYGFFCKPENNGVGIGFHVNSNNDKPVSIPLNIQLFMDIKSGEVAVGIPKFNSRLHFKADGSINIESDKVINIVGSSVNIGGEGGDPIARKNDAIIGQVTVPAGAGGTYPIINGKINTGSAKNNCT